MVLFSDEFCYWRVLLALLLVLPSCRMESTDLLLNIDYSAAIVYGPGIENPNFHLPVRYFFIQLVDSLGRNVSVSLPEDHLRLSIIALPSTEKESGHCRIRNAPLIRRSNGTFIARYRLSGSCEELRIELTTKDGIAVGKSPYLLRGKPFLLGDDCNCPLLDLKSWLKSVGCPRNVYASLKKSLAIWPKNSVNFTFMQEEVERRFGKYPGAYSVCHYVIVDNEVYRQCYGEHVGFKMFSDAILLSITRKLRLPNLEFFMNLGDWPLEKKQTQNAIPIVSWCGSDDTLDVVLPTYELTEATLEMLARQSLDILSVQGMTGPAWPNKTAKAFWRGRDSRQERLDAVLISRQQPALFDAALTNFFFFRDEMDKYGPKADYVAFGDFFKYKYQVNIDGTVAAYRFPYLLAGDSVVLKQDSLFYEFFYHDLKPWKHYIPVQRNLSDLIQQIQWAEQHEAEVLKIISNAQAYAAEHLLPLNIYCYHVRTLFELSKLPSVGPIKPSLEESAFEHVMQPDSKNCRCGDKSMLNVKDEL